uniref:SFRICE_031626 n=1 Tax=Spodoptera frugiperda TaxID=7108 RepID=A0A2H1V1G2_SPOFR
MHTLLKALDNRYKKMKNLLVFASVIALAVALPAREPVDPDTAAPAPAPELSVEDPAVLNGEPDAVVPVDQQEGIPAALASPKEVKSAVSTSGMLVQNIFRIDYIQTAFSNMGSVTIYQ